MTRAEAEDLGWVFVHDRDEYEVTTPQGETRYVPASIRAEKIHRPRRGTAVMLNEEATSLSLLLRRIEAWERQIAAKSPA